jgi:hypothetical protein
MAASASQAANLCVLLTFIRRDWTPGMLNQNCIEPAVCPHQRPRDPPPPDGDIELDEVKRRCQARNVSVWGNLELKLLEHGTPDDIRAEVRKIMRQAKEGGGFVLMPTAAPIHLPLSAKTEATYHAFIDAGLEFGRYST